MNIEYAIDKIEELAKSRDLKNNKVLVDSGAGKDFIVNLRKGQKPSIEKFILLAKYFNVSLDYFIDDLNLSKINDNSDLILQKPELKKLIDLTKLFGYRSVCPRSEV